MIHRINKDYEEIKDDILKNQNDSPLNKKSGASGFWLKLYIH